MAARASSRNIREGIVGGLIGAALVAVWLLIYHAAHWPSAETAAVAPGAHAVIRYTVFPAVVFAMLVITAPLVLEYTVVHGIAFVMFGCTVAGLLALADREPRLVYVESCSERTASAREQNRKRAPPSLP